MDFGYFFLSFFPYTAGRLLYYVLQFEVWHRTGLKRGEKDINIKTKDFGIGDCVLNERESRKKVLKQPAKQSVPLLP